MALSSSTVSPALRLYTAECQLHIEHCVLGAQRSFVQTTVAWQFEPFQLLLWAFMSCIAWEAQVRCSWFSAGCLNFTDALPSLRVAPVWPPGPVWSLLARSTCRHTQRESADICLLPFPFLTTRPPFFGASHKSYRIGTFFLITYWSYLRTGFRSLLPDKPC